MSDTRLALGALLFLALGVLTLATWQDNGGSGWREPLGGGIVLGVGMFFVAE
jgi:hypothetical protein